MDNATAAILNKKCNQFEKLYHGSIVGNRYCLGTNVGKEYMCPLVSDGRIEEMPLDPWFKKQSGKCQKAGCQCHQKMPLLGKYHLCPNQPLYSHYQEAPFQRGVFVEKKNPQLTKNIQSGQQAEIMPIQRTQKNQRAEVSPVQRTQTIQANQPKQFNQNGQVPQSVQRQQAGQNVQISQPMQRHQSNQISQPIQRQQSNQNGQKKESVNEQNGGYVFTVNPGGYESIPVIHRDPYKIYPAQEGYFIKRCVGDRNLYPNRQLSEFNLNQPIPAVPSKPPFPPIAREMIIQSKMIPTVGSQVSIIGYSNPTDNLIIDTDTPAELTNRFIMNSNIAPGYYPDMVPPMIGKRPVYTARNLESDIPEIITINKENFVDRQTACYQPSWRPKCI